MIKRNKMIVSALIAASVINLSTTGVSAYEGTSESGRLGSNKGIILESAIVTGNGSVLLDGETSNTETETTTSTEGIMHDGRTSHSAIIGGIQGVANDEWTSNSAIIGGIQGVANDEWTSNSKVSILESSGWLESASVEWQPMIGATGYNVYYKSANADNSEYKKIDDELIRKYPESFRADILGLKEGQYVIKIVPIIDNKEATLSKAITKNIEVQPHTREGFAFSEESPMKTGSGGYNDDGTIAEDAQIIYITSENVNTVQTDVITNSKGTKTTSTGLVNILSNRGKGYDKRPLIIRMIGQINGSDIKGLNSSGYIQIKGCYNVTFEGVGEDATAYGWGLLVRGSKNVELRNLGVMMFPDDAISLDTDNVNIWVHNNDIFYGAAGSDADQVKGDGSADVKGKSTYVTLSYNHFYDSGKVSLCGMNDTEEFFVTYHHNWFDHSDSRHPRIRVGSVHIYNNYFDGNSKYGVGVTKGSSAFVEANDFRNCKYPMLSSLQGSDIAGGSKGNFSSEAGGMIKAYNNKIVGATSLVYANDNSKQFDAYLATSRDEQVSSSYKTVSGGNTYNNFDTGSTMYDYTPDAVEDVRSNVTTLAGRVNGGDFKWEFTNEDDVSYGVNTDLMNVIKSYKSELVSVGGNGIDSVEPEIPEVPEVPDVPALPEVPEVPDVPALPEVPGETDKPTEPVPPLEPEVPVEPEKPVPPVDPEVPVEPEKPVPPLEPEQPVEPEKPEQPVEPVPPVDTEKPTEPEQPGEQILETHNFTTDNKDSDFFNIKGSLSTTKGSVTYDDLLLTQCLKIESSTSIKFTTTSDAKLTLVFNSNFNKSILINGVKYSAKDGIIDVELKSGDHEITKGDTGNLFYIKLSK